MAQELELLDAVEQVGPSCWEEVARLLGGVWSARQLESHFLRVYVEGRHESHPELDLSIMTSSHSSHLSSLTSTTSETILPALAPMEQPPRPPVQASGIGTNTNTVRDLAGYNPARGEFSLPPDPRAELVLSSLVDTPHTALEQELQAVMVAVYNSRLEARHRTQRIVKEHGLVSRAGHRTLRDKSGDSEQWRRYSQLLCATDLSYIVEGIKLEQELRARILKLQDLRMRGVRLLEMVPVLEALEQRRREQWMEIQWEEGGASRREAPPLDIVGMGGWEGLTQQERELSSELRLVPSVFIRLRGTLIEESSKRGGLLLSEARALLRVDVNKTRRIFDFLLKNGDIQTRTV